METLVPECWCRGSTMLLHSISALRRRVGRVWVRTLRGGTPHHLVLPPLPGAILHPPGHGAIAPLTAGITMFAVLNAGESPGPAAGHAAHTMQERDMQQQQPGKPAPAPVPRHGPPDDCAPMRSVHPLPDHRHPPLHAQVVSLRACRRSTLPSRWRPPSCSSASGPPAGCEQGWRWGGRGLGHGHVHGQLTSPSIKGPACMARVSRIKGGCCLPQNGTWLGQGRGSEARSSRDGHGPARLSPRP